ncbi:hypothetical protein GCM10023169_17030 [Georgenia halophila]|uniref:Uncharacterized protein n=1 Tax=Georgenia halophila TaxID=620889 RepID=A0ABP8L483_9MICO
MHAGPDGLGVGVGMVGELGEDREAWTGHAQLHTTEQLDVVVPQVLFGWHRTSTPPFLEWIKYRTGS